MNAKFNDAELVREDRLSSLRRTELLDNPPEPYFDRITSMVTRLLNTETALLSLVDVDRQFFASACGLPEPYASDRETPLSHSFCKYVVASNKPFIVRDAKTEPLVVNNGAVKDIGVVAYLGVPVRDPQGRVLGSLCAISGKPRNWSAEDVALMHDFARIAEDEIELRQHARRAVELANENALLAREYHHRVKNTLAVSAALVKLSARGAKSVDDFVDATSLRLTALANAHDALITDSENVDLKDLTMRLLSPYGGPKSIEPEGPKLELRHNQVTPICLFLHELATNSAKYGAFSRHGHVAVCWTRSGSNDDVLLSWIEDTGGHTDGPVGFGNKLLEAAARQLHGKWQASWTGPIMTATLQFSMAED